MFVLGVPQTPSFSDFDDAPTGLWNIYTIGNFSNKPSAAQYAGLLKSVVSASSKFQYFVEVGSNNFRAWSRTRWYNNNWSPWEEISTDIPDFYKSYNDLSSLASALGGLIINKTAIAGSDANNFETGTGYRLSGGLDIAHKPSNLNRMVIYTYADDYNTIYTKFQIACIADGSIAAREYDGNGWGDWSMTPSYLNAYSNLSSLASALGVPASFYNDYNNLEALTKAVRGVYANGAIAANTDLNTLNAATGIYGITGVPLSNAPTSSDIYGALLVFKIVSYYKTIQVIFFLAGQKICYRIETDASGGEWTEWATIS